MRPLAFLLFGLVFCRALSAQPSAPAAKDIPAERTEKLILTLPLPDPQIQTEPYALPVLTGPTGSGLLLEFPVPVMELHGRGFRIVRGERDEADTSAEWSIRAHAVPEGATRAEEIPGPFTLYLTPLTVASKRILHVTLGDSRIYSFLIYTVNPPQAGKEPKDAAKAPPAALKEHERRILAYARVRFTPAASSSSSPDLAGHGFAGHAAPSDPVPAAPILPAVERVELPPAPDLRAPTRETARGLTDYLRLIAALPAERAVQAAQQNPVFETVECGGPEQVYTADGFTLTVLWAVRDTTSNAVGLAVRVVNGRPDRLLPDARTWAMRVGSAIYGATDVAGPQIVEPHTSAVVALAFTRDLEGEPLRLAVTNRFVPSVRVSWGSARPIIVQPLQLR